MQAEVTLDSRIDHVTVFREGAVVTRAATLPEDGLPAQIALSGLPLGIDDGSVRARVVDVAGKEIEGLQVTDVRVELAIPELGLPVAPPSEAAIRAAEIEVERVRRALEYLEEETAHLDNVEFRLPERIEREPPRPVSTPVWREAAAWVERAKLKRAAERAPLISELRQARERLARLHRRVHEVEAAQGVDVSAVHKRAMVRLRGTPEGNAGVLLLEYRVPGARWRPSYVVRVAKDGARTRLGVRAHVAQRSGEPWERVRLSLSTADLQRQVDLPELKSIRIGRDQPEPSRPGWREPPRGAEALFEGLDVALAAEPSAPPPPPPIGGAVSKKEPLDLDRYAGPPQPASAGPASESRRSRAPLAPGDSPAPSPEPDMLFDALDAPEPERMADEDDLEFCEVESAEYSAGAFDDEITAPSAPGVSRAMAQMAPVAASQPPPAPSMTPKKAKARPAMRREASPQAFGAKMPVAGGIHGQAAVAGRGARSGIASPRSLSYAELRLAPWDGSRGERGRLSPISWRDRLRDLNPEQQDRVDAAMLKAAARATQLSPFPPSTHDVSQTSGAFDYRFDAEGTVDVPGDGQVHNISLFAADADSALTLVVVPRESDQAVRVAAVRNPLRAPILAGPADIYLGSEFLVESQLHTVPAGADLEIGLGVEEALKVARNAHFREAAQGLLRGGAGLEHQVEIELASRLATPVAVEVRERLPVAEEEDKEIEVEEGEVNPPWEAWEPPPSQPLKGGRRWRLSLDPGSQLKLSFSYTVHIEAKNELVGGNRRERGAR